jgi:hypothetical protein
MWLQVLQNKSLEMQQSSSLNWQQKRKKKKNRDLVSNFIPKFEETLL